MIDFIRAEITGTLCTAALLEDSPLDDLSFTARKMLWEGCLDAPEAIVAGGAKAVVIEGQLESVTARTVLR